MSEDIVQTMRRRGIRFSDLMEAEPWTAEQDASYAAQHGARSMRAYGASDIQVASAVRMLMRDELDHEGVVCAARDRICALHMEKAVLLEALTALVDEKADYMLRNNLGDPEEQHTIRQARAAIAKANGAAQ